MVSKLDPMDLGVHAYGIIDQNNRDDDQIYNLQMEDNSDNLTAQIDPIIQLEVATSLHLLILIYKSNR
jgi:hypothetical protein